MALLRTDPSLEVRVNTTTIATPVGPLTIVATDAGAVRTAGFTDDPATLVNGGVEVRPRADLGAISRAVHAYLAGELTALDEVPVEQPAGGSFLPEAWRALRRTRPGERLTYTELAARAGRPAAVRAAANACARNAAALFVPCHRIVRTDGGLGGYRWGTPVKRWLLDHEAGGEASATGERG
ncbi:MAG TPA: methylated-DNA--[protein]-cysteine S-methyltransferase [Natronosporangium sp.]|nr:methylated-DNA--[protein]-cysteine S-methyltransferase [Natronosporangium sp.]